MQPAIHPSSDSFPSNVPGTGPRAGEAAVPRRKGLLFSQSCNLMGDAHPQITSIALCGEGSVSEPSLPPRTPVMDLRRPQEIIESGSSQKG